MSEQYLELIEGLSRLMNLPLTPEEGKSIVLLFAQTLRVQIEIDPKTNVLHIASPIETIGPGKFRENVLLYALMANCYPYILTGSFAFSEKTGKLILFSFFPMEQINPDKLFEFLPRFVEKAIEWQEAIKNSTPAPSSVMQRAKKQSISPFGLRP
jgi:hypothetical protein